MKITITTKGAGCTDNDVLKHLCQEVNGTVKALTEDQAEIQTKVSAPKVLPVLARTITTILDDGNSIMVSIEKGGKHTVIVNITDEQAKAMKVASDARNAADDAFYEVSDISRGLGTQVIIGGCPVPCITEALNKMGEEQAAIEFNVHVEAIHALSAKYKTQMDDRLLAAHAERDRLRKEYCTLRDGIYKVQDVIAIEL